MAKISPRKNFKQNIFDLAFMVLGFCGLFSPKSSFKGFLKSKVLFGVEGYVDLKHAHLSAFHFFNQPIILGKNR